MSHPEVLFDLQSDGFVLGVVLRLYVETSLTCKVSLTEKVSLTDMFNWGELVGNFQVMFFCSPGAKPPRFWAHAPAFLRNAGPKNGISLTGPTLSVPRFAEGNRLDHSKREGDGKEMSPREKKLMHINHRSIKDFTTIELGYYLAGLWEADGYFTLGRTISIAFSELDGKFAWLLREVFGHGKVYSIKNKRAYVWNIYNKEGVIKFLRLIDGKVRIPSKLQQICTRIDSGLDVFSQRAVNTEPLLDSHWLAGFTDGDGNFYVQILNRGSRKEVRIHYKMALKCKYIIDCINNTFGSYVGTRIHPPSKNPNSLCEEKRGEVECKTTYYWSSTSYKNAYKVHDYFHKYHLQSTKWLNFLKWRKVLNYVHFGRHGLPSGLAEITKIKNSMNRKLTQDDVDSFY